MAKKIHDTALLVAARRAATSTAHLSVEMQEQSGKPLQPYAIWQMSEENLAYTLLESIGDAILAIDEEGRVTLLNPLAQKLTGWASKEAVGRQVTEIFNVIDPATRQALLIQPVMETLKNGIPSRRLKPSLLIARDGSEYLVADNCAPVLTNDGRVAGAVLVFRDVGEEYAARQALQDSNALVQAILNTVADAIITLRAQDGIVETANFAAEHMFGYEAAEITGQNISMLIPGLGNDYSPAALKDYRALVTILTPCLARGKLRHETIGQRKNGSVFPVEVEVSEMWLSGQRYFVGLLRDITLRKQAEEERESLNKRLMEQQACNQSLIESNLNAMSRAAHDMSELQRLDRVLQHKNAELEIAKATAEKANLAKSDFLSKMSHELRTPLNAILGFAQLLEAGNPPPTGVQAARLQQIIKAGWYLLGLINEIIDLAVVDSGKLPLSQNMVSVQHVLLECRALMEAEAQKHNVNLEFFPCDNTWFVYGDRMRIKQVLLHLLTNAVKYNQKNGTVKVRCSTHIERIRISIIDNGPGMTQEKIAQLFQPFSHLGKGGMEGTGNGLAMAKRLVELMGGTVGVNSTIGVGSEFWIELICDISPQLQPEPIKAQELMGNGRSLEFSTQKKLVNDNELEQI